MKKHAQVFMLDGVGINLEKFKAVFPEGKLEDSDDFIILYIAEFIPRSERCRCARPKRRTLSAG
ncbi:hypothetical protein [Treponema sp.]|uniref:hypothetical protein n=1 Tax=Treponema sp. TaxID=166 RepID=UPI00257C870F|nr:hypothetical protein [Treponema sp.]